MKSIINHFKSNPNNSLFLLVFLISLASLGVSLYSGYRLEKKINALVATNQAVKVYLPIKDLIKKLEVNSPSLGNPAAKVVVIEFEDFQCPFCKKFAEDTFPQIKKEYIDTNKILFIHQDLAILGLESNLASEAGRCAGEQNKFWEYRQYLYDHQAAENVGALNDASLKKIAKTLGLNTTNFNICYDSHKYKDVVSKFPTTAREYGLTGTPTFVVNGVILKGAQPFSNFQAVIDEALKK